MTAVPNTPSVPKPHFPEPVARLGDSLAGPGDPEKVFLIFREAAILAWLEQETAHMHSLEALLQQGSL